jgi:hypothetical protein
LKGAIIGTGLVVKLIGRWAELTENCYDKMKIRWYLFRYEKGALRLENISGPWIIINQNRT